MVRIPVALGGISKPTENQKLLSTKIETNN